MKEYNPFEDRHFRVEKLEKNEISVRGKTYAKLPKMPGRVFMRDSVPEGVRLTQELAADDIAFLADRRVDEETGEMFDEVVVIGKDISFFLDGMMLINEHYHEYFDRNGKLVVDPMQRHVTEGKYDSVPGTTVTGQMAEILKRKNWTRLGKKTVVRVPEIPGRIAKVRKEKDTVFIQLIYKTWKDPKTGKPRNKKTFIGKMVEYDVEAMYPNKQYEKFFDIETGELKLPFDDTLPEDARMAEETETLTENVTAYPVRCHTADEDGCAEDDEVTNEHIERELTKIFREEDELYRQEKRSKLQRAEEAERKKLRKEMEDEDDDLLTEEDREAMAYVERLAKQIRREEAAKNGQETEERDEEAGNTSGQRPENMTTYPVPVSQMETEMNETFEGMNREKERIAILKLILRGVHESIRLQARKRPDDVVNTYKVETTNSLLEEAKGYYERTGYGDLLKLIPKPVEEVQEDGSTLIYGLTYSDVDVLLSHYDTILRFIDVDI